jgi:hypothetical protein
VAVIDPLTTAVRPKGVSSNVLAMPSIVRTAGLVVAAGLVFGSCTRPVDSSAVTTLPAASATSTTVDPATDGTQSTVTTVDPAASTTAAPITTPPTTTPATAAPTTEPTATTPADLELNFDGVLPFSFGEHDADVVAGLTTVLGAPTSDVATDYPTADEGNFLDEAGEESYVFPYGRRVCYVNTLCVQFGAGAPETLLFTGWTLTSDDAPVLTMANGITIGSSWADHVDEIIIGDGGCYSVGYGDSEGVAVVVESAGEPFLSFADDGSAVIGEPDPADVTVIELRAGRSPIFVYADC